VEIWNLVFVQFNQGVDGTRTPLPNPSIDTGMGLERTAAILQGSTSVYDADVFIPLLNRVAEMSGYEYGEDEAVNKAMRIVAEHSRGIVFLIVDGVTPSNEGRGYVLRRILRRAAIFGRKLGLDKPFLKGMAGAVIHAMGSAYPELSMRRDFILQVAQMEEEKFQDTLDVGLQCLKEIIRTKQKTANLRGISGEEAFVLYDTYGFPVELTQEMAMGEGFEVDMDGFETKMERQRERARSAHKFGGKRSSGMDYSELALPGTEFIGYETIDEESRIVHLAVAGKAVDMVMAGQMVDVILDRTPFYGEMGGQVGDTGRLTGQDGVVEVEETVWSNGEIIRHRGMVLEGKMTLGDTVRAEVDAERRKDIARNHTATHLLQAALRQVLGSQVQQMGSLVAPDRMRFDFSYLRALTRDEVVEVQRRVNERVRQNMAVRSRDTLYSDAIDEGVIALFDEKYGDVVRVAEVGGASEPVSAELCGGTHASATGDIGLLFITSEGSIGAGLRRIEGVTGRGAETLVESYILSLQNLAGQLKSRPGEVLQKVTALTTELEAERKRSASMERELSRHAAEDLVDRSHVVNGIPVLVANVAASTTVALREMGDALREKLKSGVVVLGTVLDGRPQFLAMVTPDLVSRGLHAGNIIKRVAQVTGGGGGGKPEMAQAGGKDRSKLDEALGLVEMLVGRVGKNEA
jgi:alanyl-tRNA synthetase